MGPWARCDNYFAYAYRKRLTLFFVLMLILVLSIILWKINHVTLPIEDELKRKLTDMENHLEYLQSLYRSRHEDVVRFQTELLPFGENDTLHITTVDTSTTTIRPEAMALLKNLTGTKTAAGVLSSNRKLIRSVFVFQLLPHLLNDPFSIQPNFHMKGEKSYVDVVIGIPTVKRDKESYLMVTLTHLVNGLTETDLNGTIIVVMIGETDLEYVLKTAREIEIMFPKQVGEGLIEVLSPPPSYYPDLDAIPTTLGDSVKRTKWRTKQNLDTIFLMAYAQAKGTFYLMLEDDVIAKNNYMKEIKEYTTAVSVANRDWFYIEYCQVGGIGKLFKSSNLIHFITYVQLFYSNMPIDWLLESYLADKVCTIDKSSKVCGESKLTIRPRYKTSLFQHIGLYSSLKGKVHKIKDTNFGTMPEFFPHDNPPLKIAKTDIPENSDHTIKRAYEGLTFFWGMKPKIGDVVEFWFQEPTVLKSYLFRSGNPKHVSDKFYETMVEVLPAGSNVNFTVVGSFDEFGLADDEVKRDMGPLSAIRLRVMKNSNYPVTLSEIYLKACEADDCR